MRKATTSTRLKQIMNIQGLKQVDILNKCKPIADKYNKIYNKNIKITKSDLSQWISGLHEPKPSKLSILAEALNTNEVWLMGYDVSMEPRKIISNEIFNDSTKKYITDNGIEIYVPVDTDITADDILDIQDVLNDIRQGKYDQKN